jgi:dipeptidase E
MSKTISSLSGLTLLSIKYQKLHLFINAILIIIACYWIYENYSHIPEYYLNHYIFYSDITLSPSKNRNLLLFSNSTMPITGEHLGHGLTSIVKFLNPHSVREILFIPYGYPRRHGGVLTGETEALFNEKISPAFKSIGIHAKMLDTEMSSTNQQNEIRNAKAIYMSGGNTFLLTKALYDNGVMPILREKIGTGTPYIGVSAGTNIICPTMQTTNDMPICCVPNCDTLNVIPFQINVHYNDFIQGAGFSGESRNKRLCFYLQENRNFKQNGKPTFVLGLREGSMLHVSGNHAELIGMQSRKASVLQLTHGTFTTTDVAIGTRVDDLLQCDTGFLDTA